MDILNIVPAIPALSILIWVLLSMLFLFFAKEPVHKIFDVLKVSTAGGLRNIAEWTKSAAENMREKDRKVLLESGIANAQEKILQEFQSVEAGHARHLADYPSLQLRLDESISRLEADYKECGQITPQAPGWGEVLETISRAEQTCGDRIIEKMLSEIHKSALAGEKRALAEYREAAGKRHKILGGMAPTWKRLEFLGKDVNKRLERVMESSSKIDRLMNQFKKLSAGGPDSVDMLSSRMTKLFIFSMFVIGVAIFGAFINFQLIALPMSELVPAGTRVAGMMVSEVSALVIVSLEVVLGIFLVEAIGITSIFPQIAGMTLSKRRILLYASLLGLFFLASVEASLAVLRESLAEAKTALDHSLAGTTAAVSNEDISHITVIGQATLGFVLPWILAMVAVPLEMFIEASQHALTRLFTVLVTFFGHLANVLAYLLESLFNLIMHLFDAYIIIPQQIANLVAGRRNLAGSGE